MKKISMFFVTMFLIIGTSSVVLALTIDESVILNPASTQNLWRYSYQNNANYIANDADYVRQSDPYLTTAAFQGYVTGDSGNWSASYDSWDSGGASDYRSVHVFDTCITSSINQTVFLASGGDDGHSMFINDVFAGGAGYNTTAMATLNMVAGTEYKLTFIGNNFTGPFGWWFNLRGDYNSSDASYGWISQITDAPAVSMNAIAGQYSAPVPEPATMLLFGIGLLGLAGFNRKKQE